MRSKRPLLFSAAALFCLHTALAMAATAPQAVVIREKARFEILAPGVVRMEYSPTRRFVDAASVAVENRTWGSPDFHATDSAGWLEISTGKMKLRYRERSGPFTAANLLISWTDESGDHQWKPGDKDDKNLGGVPGDIRARREPGDEQGPLSRNGYFFLDDSGTAVWNAQGDWVEPRNALDAQDWYFFVYGRDFKSLFAEMTRLLGPIPMVPRYIFGTWFGSRAGYSEDEWERIIHRFRAERVPLDVVVLDSDSSAKLIWGGYDWDLEQMPDPAGFFKYAREHGVKATVNEHYGPLTPVNSQNFDRIRTAMNLPADTKEIPHDLANRKYAELFMDVLHKPALDEGMAFWWQDGNAGAKMAGLDPTLWTRYVEYTGEQRITGRRGFVFCRLTEGAHQTPAWGVHRYGAYFTGDLEPYWSTLNLLGPFNVQAGNMLIDYVNNLTAGVGGQILDSEIYQRWVEFSAFSPIFWWHGEWGLRMPWEYGPEALNTTRKFLNLRYSLIPYLYTYSEQAHENGQPLVRGVYVEYPDQENAYQFRHEYLLGRELLIAPIGEPGYGKPVFKQVYLPAGEQWFDFFTGKIYDGGQVINYETPLDREPVFVRAGSILPRAPRMDSSDQRPVDPLTLDVYAGKAASFRLYEDDGASLDYKKDMNSWTTFTYEPLQQPGEHSITIGAAEGHYQGQPETRRYKIRIHGLLQPSSVRLGDRTLAEKDPSDAGEGWSWNDQERVATIDLPAALPIRSSITLTLEGAGSCKTEKLLERLLEYRARVDRVHLSAKLKWGVVLEGADIKKEPRVVREIEQVQQALNDLVDHPQSLDESQADFKGWTARILAAFVNQPFESNRKIPELDADALESTRKIEHDTFTPDELSEMTAELLGCRLAASATGVQSPELVGRLDCDDQVLPGAAEVSYRIQLPEGSLPGWGEKSQSTDDQRFIHFKIKAPFPPPTGPQRFQLRATLKWDGGETEVTRDVDWVDQGEVLP